MLPTVTATLASSIAVAAATATEILSVDLPAGTWELTAAVDFEIPAGTALGQVTGVVFYDGAGVSVGNDWTFLQGLVAAGASVALAETLSLSAPGTVSLQLQSSVAVTVEPDAANVSGPTHATRLRAVQIA